LQNGVFTRIIVRVKTTVELDEQKLLRVMQLTGLKTRKEAIDYALSQAERAAKIAKLFARPRRSKEELRNLLDPNYDLMTLREQEKPQAKLKNLVRRDVIVGDPEDLVHLDWSKERRGNLP
jgi:Arc/MetJ family transcription regulator